MEKRGYINRSNKHNDVSIKITDPVLVDKIHEVCKVTNTNVSRFVENCVKTYLEEEQKAILNCLSKEELINMIINGKEA